MKTLIALPCMDMVNTEFMRSLLAMDKVGQIQYSIVQSSLIYDSRNTLAKYAIQNNCDRILWIDSDMVFDSDLMKRLSADMDEGRDFVAALFFKRKAPIHPVIYKDVGYYKNDDGTITPAAKPYDDYPEDDIFKVQASGFGAVMVSVDLIKKVVEKYGLPFSPAMGFGEDLSFCNRVAELGVDMWCDSRIKVGHIGSGVITETIYKASNGG